MKPIRNSIKVILLNDKNELLLMRTNDSKIMTVQGKYHGQFWQMIGGAIEPGEKSSEAAIREVFEETGILLEEKDLGPVVWVGEFDLILHGKPTHIKQSFLVAKTKENKLSLTHLKDEEIGTIERLAWFSQDQILHSHEIIYPVVLPEYLPDILLGRYPKKPKKIDLTKQPIRWITKEA